MRCSDRSRTIYYSSLTWTHQRRSLSPSWLSASNKKPFSSSSSSLSLRFPASLPPVFQSGIASLRKRFPTESGFIICESKAVFLQVGGFNLQKRFSELEEEKPGFFCGDLWCDSMATESKLEKRILSLIWKIPSISRLDLSVSFFDVGLMFEKSFLFVHRHLNFPHRFSISVSVFVLSFGSSRIYSLDWFDRGQIWRLE